MYARITRVQSPPERLDDVVQAFKGTALPAVKEMPGYAGSVLAFDGGSGDGQVVTFWESLEALDDSAVAAAGIRTETVQAGGGKVVSVDVYEVALLERAGRPSMPAFLRVVRSGADVAKLDAVVEAARTQAVPALRALDGFRALNVGVDRDGGQLVITTVWDSAAAREASNASIDALRRSIFEIGGATNLETSLYEVHHVEFVGVGAAT